MSTLASLLEQSRRLTKTQHSQLPPLQSTSSLPSAQGGANDLPVLQLGFDQLVSQSRRILARAGGSGAGTGREDGAGNAYYLLASGGVNADLLANTINNVNLTATFEPLLPLSDGDVEGYLKHTHEQTIISSIEEGRRSTLKHFYKNLDTQSRATWEKQKEKLFEELGRHSGSAVPALGESKSGTPVRRRTGAGGGYDRSSPKVAPVGAKNGASGLQMHSLMMRYDTVVKKLNEYRKGGVGYGLIERFMEASKGVGTDVKSTATLDTWKLLASLAGERDVVKGEFQRAVIHEGQYNRAYLAEAGDMEGIELRKRLVLGAKGFLEAQFRSYVERTISQRPTEAQLGGNPSSQNKIRGFLNVKFLKNGSWTPGVEIANNTPVWARMFYLLRAGHVKESLDFAVENEMHIAKLEKNFLGYFRAWIESTDGRLPKQLQSRFLTEYNQRINFSSTPDPYKQALYKLIGRTELSRKNVAGVTSTTEDWIWFQLSLVREESSLEGLGEERFTLRDLGKCLVRFGEAHFDPKGNKPMPYFQVLLLCGEFERAVAFLYGHSQFQTDAVHFAIALAYYGLIRTPDKVKITDVDLLVLTSDDVPALNFSRLLYRYTRAFVLTDAPEALNYIYLVCLNAGEDAKGREQVAICHEYIREVVMDTRQYTELLGDVRADGTKVPGMLELDLKLIKLKDEKSYLHGIVKSAAKRADQEKRFSEAILLYNIAEEYDAVISVLNVELGASLSKPSLPTTSFGTEKKGVHLGMAVGMEDIVGVTRAILEHYDKLAGINSRVGRKNRECCEMLLRLKECLGLYEEGKLEQALMGIEAINLIPLSSDLVAIIRAAEQFQSNDEAIIRNIDLILLTTMNIIYKIHLSLKESPYGDAARSAKMMALRGKARGLMMFAGMVRFRLGSDTYATLTRLDTYVH